MYRMKGSGTEKFEENMEGFDLTIVYCLGCSWSGSPKTGEEVGMKGKLKISFIGDRRVR